MNGVYRIGGFAVFVLLLVAGCTSGSAAPRPSTSPSTSTAAVPPSSTAPPAPTVPADVPTTGPNTRPGERPPVMPVAATKHTAAGAKAFAVFFIKTIDWAYATTSTTYMRHYFDRSCVGCSSIARAIDGARTRHRHFIGDRLAIKSATLATRAGPRDAELNIVVRFDVSSGDAVDKKGRSVSSEPALRNYGEEVFLRWDSAWSVVELDVVR